MILRGFFFFIGLMWASFSFAVEPSEILEDAALEERARVISQDLRCLVCQNQSIDDSDADLAKDLRVLVRERLVAGDSNEEVLSFITDRYGNYVLLDPPMNAQTMILWAGPIGIFLIGSLAVFFWYRGRLRGATVESSDAFKNRTTKPSLSAAEEARLKELLGEEDDLKQ